MSRSGLPDENKQKLPSAAECGQRCHKFSQIADTDTTLATTYLKDQDWCLKEDDSGDTNNTVDDDASTNTAARDSRSIDKESYRMKFSFEQYRIRLLSWNIDGLDDEDLVSRTLGVCDTINNVNPHAVFLQEVVPETEDILKERCPTYQTIPGNNDGYYTMMMLKHGAVELEESTIVPYPNTTMMRNLLTAKCTIKGEKFELMTSHLESMKEKTEERKKQLQLAFSHLAIVDMDRTVIFGGDLNLRDKEVAAVGGLPDKVSDIWEITGKRPEAKFTWDTQRNDNLELTKVQSFKPRCRFDRLYIRHSEPEVVKVEYFELIGQERLESCQRFCTDHWGLLTHLNILSKLPK